MASTNFQDLSGGSKILIVTEFLLLSVAIATSFHLNQLYGLINQEPLPNNLLVVYTLIFAFTTQLSMLSLGLYNPKLRENFRTIFPSADASLRHSLLCSQCHSSFC